MDSAGVTMQRPPTVGLQIGLTGVLAAERSNVALSVLLTVDILETSAVEGLVAVPQGLKGGGGLPGRMAAGTGEEGTAGVCLALCDTGLGVPVTGSGAGASRSSCSASVTIQVSAGCAFLHVIRHGYERM